MVNNDVKFGKRILLYSYISIQIKLILFNTFKKGNLVIERTYKKDSIAKRTNYILSLPISHISNLTFLIIHW